MSAPPVPPSPDARDPAQAERFAATTRALSLRFAWVLRWGVRLALLAIVCTFVAYVSGVLPGAVPLERVPTLLRHGVRGYVAASGLPAGWAWLVDLRWGDELTLGALLALMSVIVVAYASLLGPLLRARERMYTVLVLLQLAIFALAASGVLG